MFKRYLGRTCLGTLALALLVAAGGCALTQEKSSYPAQYKEFKKTANAGCKHLFAAMDAQDADGARAALKTLLSAKAPPDLRRRWQIYKGDIRRYFLAPKVIADRAANALDDGAEELGLDEC